MPDIPEERGEGGSARIDEILGAPGNTAQTLQTGSDTLLVARPKNVKQRFKAMLETERRNNEASQLKEDALLAQNLKDVHHNIIKQNKDQMVLLEDELALLKNYQSKYWSTTEDGADGPP